MAVPDTRMNLTDMGDTFSALAQETISGGQLVKAVSGTTVLTASNALDNVMEIALVNAGGDESLCVGVAETTGVSGDRITVKMTGIHGFKAGAAVTVGAQVEAQPASTADSVIDATAGIGSKIFGKALGAAASGELVPVKLML